MEQSEDSEQQELSDAAARHPAGSRSRRRRKKKNPKIVLGWREFLTLSELGVDHPVKAKVDTGAATSSLHAHRMTTFPRDDAEWVKFTVYPRQRTKRDAVQVEAKVKTWRNVRSSNGKSERRPVITTTVEIAGQAWPIDVTLTSRDQMGFRMLLGRRAVRGRAVVDVSKSYLGTPREKK